MRTVGDFKRALDIFEIEDAVYQALEETQEYISDLNAEQINKGIRSDGSMMPDYSPISVRFFGKPEGPIKLYDTGDFYRGFFTRIDRAKKEIFHSSTDKKTTDIIKGTAAGHLGYGKEVFGLSQPYKRRYIEDALQPELVRLRKKALGI